MHLSIAVEGHLFRFFTFVNRKGVRGASDHIGCSDGNPSMWKLLVDLNLAKVSEGMLHKYCAKLTPKGIEVVEALVAEDNARTQAKRTGA